MASSSKWSLSVTNSLPKSKRDKVKLFFKGEYVRGKLKVQHSLGLGHQPNVVPPGEINISGKHRTVRIGWHPVAGLAGKWFAEKTDLGKMITDKIHKYPDPTQHWAILVGDYGHQLWMDENLDVIYINEKIVEEEWHTFEVGNTRFNDEALRQAGEMVIFNMRAKRPAYNLISNNCQTFALLMLDAVQVGAHRQFATSFAVYERAIGSGKISDLFVAEEVEQEESPKPDEPFSIVTFAQNLMEENTTKLDTHFSRR